MPSLVLRHRVVDLHSRTIVPCEIRMQDGRIESISPWNGPVDPGVLIPGFVDAHVHVESTMMPPSEFARAVVGHGTVGAVSDPHEIANVLGEPGIEFMLRDAARRNFHFHFGCPSCVPATPFETAGATLDSVAVARLLKDPRMGYLSEMMNWPGVLQGDAEVLAKISAAKAVGKPVDGHAPRLMGEQARRYVAAGITTDHECVSLGEARHKAQCGMSILIREGSAARNFEALWPLLKERPEQCMFCTDDAHPDVLRVGHINTLVARAVSKGIDVMDALRAACMNPVLHYGLACGLLRVGDSADAALVEDLESFKVIRTWIHGEVVANNGHAVWSHMPVEVVNQFRSDSFQARDFIVRAPASAASVVVRVIDPVDGELVTGERFESVPVRESAAEPVTGNHADVAFLTVVNRYNTAPPAVAFIRGFGLQQGAIAASVAHDCHNVVAVAGNRKNLATAVNAIFASRGGLAVCDGTQTHVLPLPIAGLMSDQPFQHIAQEYERLTSLAHRLGSPLRAPFMTLNFMALLVIPSLKLSDRGLFDGQHFRFVQVVESAS